LLPTTVRLALPALLALNALLFLALQQSLAITAPQPSIEFRPLPIPAGFGGEQPPRNLT
jgi:hypothetical protein